MTNTSQPMTAEAIAKVEDLHGKWRRSDEGGVRADLADANLAGANLTGANLTRAYLTRANLAYANLAYANLTGADLTGANLAYANLAYAYLNGAILTGAKMNWQSHDLIAELLRRKAGDDPARRSLVGLILVSKDWCWNQFLALQHHEREWALGVLREYAASDADAPEVIRTKEAS